MFYPKLGNLHYFLIVNLLKTIRSIYKELKSVQIVIFSYIPALHTLQQFVFFLGWCLFFFDADYGRITEPIFVNVTMDPLTNDDCYVPKRARGFYLRRKIWHFEFSLCCLSKKESMSTHTGKNSIWKHRSVCLRIFKDTILSENTMHLGECQSHTLSDNLFLRLSCISDDLYNCIHSFVLYSHNIF